MFKKVMIIFVFIVICFIFIFKEEVAVVNVEKINLNLKEEEIGVVFIDQDKDDYLLILSDKVSLLLVLDNLKQDIEKILNKFNVYDVKFILIKDNNIRIDKNIIKLMDYYKEGDIEFFLKEDIIKIVYGDTSFCIYINSTANKLDIFDCNLVYFYKVLNIPYLKINERTDVIFYHYERPLPSYLVEKIYEKWINTYMIRNNEWTVIKIGDGYYNIIVIPNS